MESLFVLRQAIYSYMKIYIYDEETNEYIGELNTASNRTNVPHGTMLIVNKIKYLVVRSEQVENTNDFTVTVNRA